MTSSPRQLLGTLRARAERAPDRLAFQLVGDEGAVRLDYGALAENVALLGRGFAAAGIVPGDRVAICMESRPAWPVVYLATWYAGGVTVPIDPALEADAVRRILEHSGARFCITSARHGDVVEEACSALEAPPAVYDVDSGEPWRWDGAPDAGGIDGYAEPSTRAPLDDVIAQVPTSDGGRWSPHEDPDTMATIVYTSGTTGLPKGVVLARRAIQANIEAVLGRIDLRGEDHVLGVLPLFHVLPLMSNCLGPIHCGAQVTYLSELNPDRILGAFRDHAITGFACVPLFYYRFHERVMERLDSLPKLRRAVARRLLRLSRFCRERLGVNVGRRLFAAAHEPFGASMRLLVTGGARFDPAVYRDFLDLGFTLVQGYGLTEATSALTAHAPDDLRPDTVGPAVDGVELKIAEPNEEGIGEILARSPSLMTSYYRNDGATREVLREGWLHTGDLGRVLDDGHLQVTGRAKDVIVLASGKNIYPEELEAYYGRAETVAEICILGLTDARRRGAERLHAVVVPDMDVLRKRGQVNVKEMVTWELDSLGAKLPGPQRVTSLELRSEPLPRTTTRKLKRFVLQQEIVAARAARQSGAGEGRAAEDDGVASTDGAAPAGSAGLPDDAPEWAHRVVALVGEHAREAEVRPDQHLDMDLGLESLDRVELQAGIEDELGIEMPAERAGRIQTVEELLEEVGRLLDADPRQGGAPTRDRWARVLEETPPGIEQYIRRGRIRERLLWWTAFAALRLGFRLGGVSVRGLENIPRESPFILAANHNSYIDPFLLTSFLPYRVYERIFFVGYSAYFEKGLGRLVSRHMRTIPIDQNRHLERAMQAAAAGLRRQLVLGIFPEGGRSIDGTLQRFRRGTGILARYLDVPVVPVGLRGTYEMWPRDGSPRLHRAAIAFGPPCRVPVDADREAIERFMTELRQRVAALVDQCAD